MQWAVRNLRTALFFFSHHPLFWYNKGMKTLTALKVLTIVFAVIIIVLLGVLFFYNPAHGPTIPAGSVSTSTVPAVVSTTQSQ
jgi:hypothetical protein